METAVVVLATEVQDVVGAHRARFDRSAGRGVPPHVTVVYPFAPDIDDDILDALSRAVYGIGAFECGFARTAWVGTDVLWLAPDPAEPFRQLIAAVVERFPGYQPYSGADSTDVEPHLTVGERTLASVEQLRQAEAEVSACLPVTIQVTHLAVLASEDASRPWRMVATIPLAGVTAGS